MTTEKVWAVMRVIVSPAGSFSVVAKAFTTEDAAKDFVAEERQRIHGLMQGGYMAPGMREPQPLANALASLGIAGLNIIIAEIPTHQSNLVVPSLILPHN